ncbi:MAG: CRISPR-associated exonuclease Cas4/endonuclease Cas1 fusion [Gemmataceae bacterium]|jgi:CRISPR-associated protein Cas1|nr:MAG: CRISPR-associated exonuclease Cas4/endonuclease Cas1 fusion [Gemmataceae bacterium]
MFPLNLIQTHEPPLRAMALRALGYCPRLFYLEEVEGIYLANEDVMAGRHLHARMDFPHEAGQWLLCELVSERLGLVGRVDCLRRYDGLLIPYEHKRGRPAQGENGEPIPWPGDRLQVIAYALMLEEALEQAVPEARIHYHTANLTVRVPVDADARRDLQAALEEARRLRQSLQRPPLTDNPKLCQKCSHASFCLPEYSAPKPPDTIPLPRLFPPDRDGTTLHILTPGATVAVAGNNLLIRTPDGNESRHPIHSVEAVLLYGAVHLSVHAMYRCLEHGISIHWLTTSGFHLASLTLRAAQVQRRIRQFQALSDPQISLALARLVANAKLETQYRYLLRASRGNADLRQCLQNYLSAIQTFVERIPHTSTLESLRGLEGAAATHYFAALRHLLAPQLPQAFHPSGRSRRPPLDRFNALLSYGYGLLHTAVMRAVLTVGLDPAFGFFHKPHSASYPLVLDLMDLFRVILWDMPLIASLNRQQWHPDEDFLITPTKVYLSDSGKKKAVTLFEQRLQEHWKHPLLGYSLSYARTIELEVRLLEKEWSEEPGFFARARIR